MSCTRSIPLRTQGNGPKGPGSGYGVKKAAAGAQQHLDFAVKAEGASDNVKTHATHVAGVAERCLRWTEEAIAVAQKIRAATSAGRRVRRL